MLNGIEVVGSTVFEPSAFFDYHQGYVGQNVTLARVYEIAERVTQHYSEAGYAVSIAFVPAQEVTDGRVKIQIAEGYISEIEISGDGKRHKKLLTKYGDKLRASRPLLSRDLERYLLLANDLPGVTVRGVFEGVGAEIGATKLVLDVDSKPVELRLGLNNRGSLALGRGRFDVGVTANSILRQSEELSVAYVQAFDTKELLYGSASLSVPIGAEGTKLSVFGSYSDAEPGTDLLRLLNFESDSIQGSIEIEHPFVRRRRINLFGSISFEGKQLESDLLSQTNTEDQIWVAQLQGDLDFLDSLLGLNQINIGLRQGLDIFDATTENDPNRSRAFGSGQFTSANLGLSRLQRLSNRIDVFGTMNGQFSSRQLLSSEQCGYGGALFGRGFDSFEISGDHCLQASLEMRGNLYRSPEGANFLQPYVFYDIGQVWQRGAVVAGTSNSASGQSIGGGARFELADTLAGYVEYAQPLARDVGLEENRDGRVFFALQAAF